MQTLFCILVLDLKFPWAHSGEVVPGSTRSGMVVSYLFYDYPVLMLVDFTHMSMTDRDVLGTLCACTYTRVSWDYFFRIHPPMKFSTVLHVSVIEIHSSSFREQ